MLERADIVVVGLGAAGLMAAIWAGRAAREEAAHHGAAHKPLRIIGLDGAVKLGAKILVAGGGRCNVTHFEVSERDYAGSSRNAIRNVLRSFDVPATVAFFESLGVRLKREETGKLFPTTDRARTVLDALLAAAAQAGVELRHPARVERIERVERVGAGNSVDGEPPASVAAPRFAVSGPWGRIEAGRVILAAGGMALPRSGSDGAGYAMAKALGHSVTPHIDPALVPLRTDEGWFLTTLSGIAAPATVEVRSGTGKRLASFTDAVLCTHFGLSGPAILNVSRFLTEARREDAGTGLWINWLPGVGADALDAALVRGQSARVVRVIEGAAVGEALPARLVAALLAHVGVDEATTAGSLTREQRRRVVEAFTGLRVPVVGDRGFTHAEVTAGGIPLSEVKLGTMESRVCPRLHLCGEILDVDGRIGGFNFQWAWASGWLAGRGAVAEETERRRGGAME